MTDSDGANQPLTPTPPPPPPPPLMAPPAGYIMPGGYQHQTSPQFRRVGSIGRAMSILMMIMIAVQVIALALSPAARDAARDFLAGSSEREFRDALGPSAAMSVVTGLLVIALAVLTMIWMFRMAKNLQIVQRVATWTPGWAIGGWFLPPGVLYVIPYLMLRDLWRGSSPEHNDWRHNTISPLVHAWWVFYGLLPIAFVTITLSGTSIRGTNLRKVARNLDDQFARSIAAGIVQIAAAMVYLALVRQLTQRHARFTHETP